MASGSMPVHGRSCVCGVDIGRAVVRQPFDGLLGLRGARALPDGCMHHGAHHIPAMSAVVAAQLVASGCGQSSANVTRSRVPTSHRN